MAGIETQGLTARPVQRPCKCISMGQLEVDTYNSGNGRCLFSGESSSIMTSSRRAEKTDAKRTEGAPTARECGRKSNYLA